MFDQCPVVGLATMGLPPAVPALVRNDTQNGVDVARVGYRMALSEGVTILSIGATNSNRVVQSGIGLFVGVTAHRLVVDVIAQKEKQHMVKSSSQAPVQPSPLSPRERQLLTALADGSTRTELAVEWGISVGTIHNHIRVIHAKLAARTTEQALAGAIRKGWL